MLPSSKGLETDVFPGITDSPDRRADHAPAALKQAFLKQVKSLERALELSFGPVIPVEQEAVPDPVIRGQ